MPIPLAVPLAVMAGSAIAGYASNMYAQSKQRELYRYQRSGYERAYAQWRKNVPNRRLARPELSYPGRIRALDTGISESYASSIGSTARLTGQFAGGTIYGRNRSGGLFTARSTRSSRWL